MVAEASGLIGLRVKASKAEYYPGGRIYEKEVANDLVGRIAAFDVEVTDYIYDTAYHEIEVTIEDDNGKHWYAKLDDVSVA